MGQAKITNDSNNLNNNEQVVDPIKRQSIASGKQSTKDGDSSMQIDQIIGDFSYYQFVIFLLKILIGATSAFNNLGVSFYAPNDFVSHWCDHSLAAPEVQTYNSTVLNNYTNVLSSNANLTHNYLTTDSITDFIVNNERYDRHNSANFSMKTPKNLRSECAYVTNKNETLACKTYEYDKGIWLSTIIDEWDLVCDRSWLISMTQSLYMSGFILSFPIFGYLSDRYGRWKSVMLGALIEMSAGFGCAFANSIYVFMFFRFLIGFGNAGRTSASYLIMIEWVGPKWRMAISTLGTLGWVFGYIALPWLTLFFLHFRHMQLFVCLYEFVFILCLILVPESPRWLLSHKRYDEARKVLLRAARFNKLIVEEDGQEKNGVINNQGGLQASKNMLECHHDLTKTEFKALDGKTPIENGRLTIQDDNSHKAEPEVKPMTIQEYNSKFDQLIETIEAKEFTKNEDNLTILDLLKLKNLRSYLLILFFIWASNSFVYYGIALRVGGDNLFVSYTIAGIAEFPSIFFTIVCMKYLPRKTSNVIIYTMTGLLAIIQIPLTYYDYGFLLQCCIMLAKVSNSCAFDCILYQTMELFPTSIRQTAYTSCSFAGRIGSILAPFVKELAQKTNESVPALLYALFSAMAVCLITLLPETKGSDLHDTLMEAEKFEGTKPTSTGMTKDLESSLDYCELRKRSKS